MVRPVGHPLHRRAVTVHDLREEFLARCQARNLSDRTIQWYEDRSQQFAKWRVEASSQPRHSTLVARLRGSHRLRFA